MACIETSHLPCNYGGKYNQTYKILWASRMWRHALNYTTSHPNTPYFIFTVVTTPNFTETDIWFQYKADDCSPNSASVNVSRTLVNAVNEFQLNTVAIAKVSGFEFTSAQRTDRFCAKRAPHLSIVQRMPPRPPPSQDVTLNGVQAQLQQTQFNSQCAADENNFRYPHEFDPLQLCQCAVRPAELRVTPATTNRSYPPYLNVY
jgi:hypothetical protein